MERYKMTDEDFFKELNFIREQIFKSSDLISSGSTHQALFLLGNLYAEVRNLCISIEKEMVIEK